MSGRGPRLAGRSLRGGPRALPARRSRSPRRRSPAAGRRRRCRPRRAPRASIRSTRSRSSRSSGANSKKPNGSFASLWTEPSTAPEVRLPDPERPRQQQQLGVLGPRVGTAMTSRQLVPTGLQSRVIDAGVARERRSSGRRRADLGKHANELRMDSSEAAGPRQELPAAGAIAAPLSVRTIERDEQAGAGFVRNRMKCQERFADAPLSPLRQLFQRDLGPLPEDPPLLGHELGNRTSAILGPRAPPSRGLPDRVAPVCVATRRPRHSVRRRQDEPIRLGALQDHLGEREDVRRPLEQLIPDRAPRDRLPRGRQRRLAQTLMRGALLSDDACGRGHSPTAAAR